MTLLLVSISEEEFPRERWSFFDKDNIFIINLLIYGALSLISVCISLIEERGRFEFFSFSLLGNLVKEEKIKCKINSQSNHGNQLPPHAESG